MNEASMAWAQSGPKDFAIGGFQPQRSKEQIADPFEPVEYQRSLQIPYSTGVGHSVVSRSLRQMML